MPNRLAGHFGAVYAWNGSAYAKIADIYDWEFTVGAKLYDCSIKSDLLERFAASHGSGIKFTAKRRTEGINVFPTYVGGAGQNGTQNRFRLDLVDNNNSFTQFECFGFAEESSNTAPPEAADERMTLQIDQYWAVAP